MKTDGFLFSFLFLFLLIASGCSEKNKDTDIGNSEITTTTIEDVSYVSDSSPEIEAELEFLDADYEFVIDENQLDW